MLLHDTVRKLYVGFQLRGEMLDIFTTKTYDSDKGCQMMLKIAIVKTAVLSATLPFRYRKIDILFADSHPSQSFFCDESKTRWEN